MSAKTVRLTMAQALVKYLTCQYVERDGDENALFAGCFGVFGHGCVSGVGQALQQYPRLRYYQTRNEQAMVHASTAYAKMKRQDEKSNADVCMSFVDWPRSDKHDYRSGGGDNQSSACAAAAGRYIRTP
ncbi:MAG: hypothetical protein ACYSW0_19750 [Planctomycetota bacterium]|jgi:TPP-dependent trihydroxycyclohexane-1,2-dione (THcHDO) dehydratase